MRNNLKLIVNNKFYKKEKFFVKKELQSILNLYAKKVSAGDWKDYGLSINKKEITFDIYLRSKDGPNAGGLLLDLIRGIQYSRDLNESGNIQELSNFGFKSTLFDNKLRNSYKEFFNKYIVN